MSDPNTLTENLLTLLRALPDIGGRIFSGPAPDDLPSDGVHVRPYVVVWAGIGSDIERDLTHLTDNGKDWEATTIVVASTPDDCRRAAWDVSQALTNQYIGGWIIQDPDSHRLAPYPDTSYTPSRSQLPLMWRVLST